MSTSFLTQDHYVVYMCSDITFQILPLCSRPMMSHHMTCHVTVVSHSSLLSKIKVKKKKKKINIKSENKIKIKIVSVKFTNSGLSFSLLYFLFLFLFRFVFPFSIFRTTRVRVDQSCCHISHNLMA